MILQATKSLLLLAGAAVIAGWPDAGRAATAGIFQFVSGEVRLQDTAREREARKGMVLNVGETVITARNATAQIKMGDGAIVVVQPLSRLTVAAYRYDGKEDGTERVVFRLEQGGFRSVTGAIGNTHKNNYLIETPVAHMGVRGTDHESYYLPPGSDAGQPGAYNKVNTGLTFIRTSAGEVVIAPNQVGFAASRQSAPAVLPNVPGFFNRAVAPRSARPQAPEVAAARPEVVQQVEIAGGMPLTGGGAGELAIASGPVQAFVERVGGTSFGRSAINATVAPNGASVGNAGGDGAFGVSWGTWQGGAPTVNGNPSSGGVHFATSTQFTTPAQLGTLVASNVSATYSYLGGPAPTNQAGVQGTISALSVGVNFGTQSITHYNVDAVVDGRTWGANAIGNPTLAQFTSGGINLQARCTGCSPGPGQTAGTGSANGAFVGSAAERMITSFGLRAGQHAISGVGYLGR